MLFDLRFNKQFCLNSFTYTTYIAPIPNKKTHESMNKAG